MAITVPSDFLALVRRELADTVEPYLWSDADLYQYMNEAEAEFARDTKCILDSETYTDIPYTLNSGWINYDPEIIDIKRAVSGSGHVLQVMTEEEFSDLMYVDDYGQRSKGRWEDETGTPSHLLLNLSTDEIRMYPIPTVADTLDMYVWREPLNILDGDSVGFEIPKRFIYMLMYKMKAMAYSKQDFETFDGDKRTDNLLLWNDAKDQAQSRIKRRQRKPRSIKYGGI